MALALAFLETDESSIISTYVMVVLMTSNCDYQCAQASEPQLIVVQHLLAPEGRAECSYIHFFPLDADQPRGTSCCDEAKARSNNSRMTVSLSETYGARWQRPVGPPRSRSEAGATICEPHTVCMQADGSNVQSLLQKTSFSPSPIVSCCCCLLGITSAIITLHYASPERLIEAGCRPLQWSLLTRFLDINFIYTAHAVQEVQSRSRANKAGRDRSVPRNMIAQTLYKYS